LEKQSSNIPPQYNAPPPYYEDDEITLKELVLKIREFGTEVWVHKKWVLSAAVLTAIIFLFYAWNKEVTYTSALTFLLDEQEISSTDLGYAKIENESTNFGLDKLVVLTRSDRIINQVLLKKVTIDDKKDFLANHLINLYNFHENWEKNQNLKGFYFSSSKLDNFNEYEYLALNQLHDFVTGNKLTGKKGVTTISYNKTGMINLQVTTKNSDLSTNLINTIFEKLSSFYIEQTVGRLQKTYDLLENRAQIVKQDLDSANENLEVEFESNYNLSLTNAIEYLSTLLENANKEKAIAVELANQEKAIAVELANKKKAFAEEQLSILNQEKDIALEKIGEELRVLRVEKEFLEEKVKNDLELAIAEKELELEKVNGELAIANAEKEIADFKTAQLLGTASKRDKKNVDGVEEVVALANAKNKLKLERLSQAELYTKIRDSLMVEEEKVNESIINYRAALVQFNKEKSLGLEVTRWRLTKEQETGMLKLDSIRQQLEAFRQEEVKDSLGAANLVTIRNSRVDEKVQKSLDHELELSEYVRTRKMELSLEKLSREVENNNSLYTELLKNKQSLEFILKNRTPQFQIIDQTFFPIVNATSKITSLLIGAFIGSFLSIGYIIGRKIIRDAMV